MQMGRLEEVDNDQVVQTLHAYVGVWLEQSPQPNKWHEVLTQVHTTDNNQPANYEMAQMEKAINY